MELPIADKTGKKLSSQEIVTKIHFRLLTILNEWVVYKLKIIGYGLILQRMN
jgi:hypothetical protein